MPGTDEYAANHIGLPIYTVTGGAIWKQMPHQTEPVQVAGDGWWRNSQEREKQGKLKCPK